MARARQFSLVLTDDDLEALETMAARKFGGNKTAAVRSALRIAAAVYSEPQALASLDPESALVAYVRARSGSSKERDL